MPTLSLAVDDLTHHVFLPVIRQLTHRILKMLNYTDEVGDRIFINTDWMAASKTSDINNNPILGQQCFKVEPNIQLNPTSQKWDCYTFHHTTAYGLGTTLKNLSFPVYFDKLNRVTIVQMVSPVTIVLSCELILQSAELAFKTPQMIFNGYENGSVIHFNDLAYDYPVPESIISVLEGLWEMDRDEGKPAGVNFIQYLQNHTEGTWSYQKNRRLDEYEIVIPCFDLKTLASLEYSEDKPQGVMQDRLPVGFSIPFQYIVQFGMPTLNIMTYPVVYNNQLVPKRLIPIDTNQRFNNMDESHHGITNEGYEKAYQRPQGTMAGPARFPYYDDWQIPSNSRIFQSEYAPIMYLALTVDEEHEIDIEDLSVDFSDEIKLSPMVKELLYQQGVESCGTDVLYNVALYRDDKELVPVEDWLFNHDLQVSFQPQDLHCHYHIVISALMNLMKLNPKWWGLLFKYYPVLPEYVRAFINNQVNTGNWYRGKGKVQVGPDGNIYDEYGKVIDKLTNIDVTRLNNANNSASRVIRYAIFPRKA